MPTSLGSILQAMRSHGRFWSRRVMRSDVFLERIILVAEGGRRVGAQIEGLEKSAVVQKRTDGWEQGWVP